MTCRNVSPSKRVSTRISQIQLACENRIGVFQLGRINGKTVDKVLAPSLRKIIESPKIVKVGMSVDQAHFARLRRLLGISPRGDLDLSHLDSYPLISKTSGGNLAPQPEFPIELACIFSFGISYRQILTFGNDKV